jgi:hypothetical protein
MLLRSRPAVQQRHGDQDGDEPADDPDVHEDESEDLSALERRGDGAAEQVEPGRHRVRRRSRM